MTMKLPSNILFVFYGDTALRSIESIHDATSMPMLQSEFISIIEIFEQMQPDDKLSTIGIANFDQHMKDTKQGTYSNVYMFRRIADTYFRELFNTFQKEWPSTYFDTVQARSAETQAAVDRRDKMRNADKLPKLRAYHLVIVKQHFPVNNLRDRKHLIDLEECAELKVTAFEHNSICSLFHDRMTLAIVGADMLATLAQRPVDIAQIHIFGTEGISDEHRRLIFNFASDNRIPINVQEEPVIGNKDA